MNPYAAQLGAEDAKAVIGKTPGRLAATLAAIGPEGLERPLAPGKWSPRQVAAHLADCEIAFGFRIRQTLAEDEHVMQPFDQDKWAMHYLAYDAASAIELFTMLRKWNVALIGSLQPADFDRKVSHPERGAMTLKTIVETMAGHDLNHLKQLERVKA